MGISKELECLMRLRRQAALLVPFFGVSKSSLYLAVKLGDIWALLLCYPPKLFSIILIWFICHKPLLGRFSKPSKRPPAFFESKFGKGRTDVQSVTNGFGSRVRDPVKSNTNSNGMGVREAPRGRLTILFVAVEIWSPRMILAQPFVLVFSGAIPQNGPQAFSPHFDASCNLRFPEVARCARTSISASQTSSWGGRLALGGPAGPWGHRAARAARRREVLLISVTGETGFERKKVSSPARKPRRFLSGEYQDEYRK